MGYRYNTVTYETPGTYTYVPPEGLYGVELIVRGAGGGGASGQQDNRNEDCLPGPGGGGGGCSYTPRLVLRDELPDAGMQVRVGSGGVGGIAANRTWSIGSDGGDSWFGAMIFAGGGGGGGKKVMGDGMYTESLTAGGVGGFGMSRGGRGLHYQDRVRSSGGSWLRPRYSRLSEADTSNEAHMAAGGGGGGHGQGHTGKWKDVVDEDTGEVIDEEWDQTNYAWRFGGSSNAVPQATGSGAPGRGHLPHWQTLQSGCGGNGSSGETINGAPGGFPGGGGAGGSGGGSRGGTGGAGGHGSVTIIELYSEDV